MRIITIKAFTISIYSDSLLPLPSADIDKHSNWENVYTYVYLLLKCVLFCIHMLTYRDGLSHSGYFILQGLAEVSPAWVWLVSNNVGVIIYSFNWTFHLKFIWCAWVWYGYVTELHAYDFVIKDFIIRWGCYLCRILCFIFFTLRTSFVDF